MSFKTPLGKTIFETKPISAGCEFVSGYAFKSKDFAESGFPVIKIKNIQNKQVTLNGDNQFIPKSVITEKLNKFRLTHGDILIAMTGQGSVGRVGKLVLNDKRATPYLNQRVGKFVTHPNVLDKDYLYYVISTSAYESLLFAAGSGSGQPNLSPAIIKGVEIPFPPVKVQESISKILRDLDEKIVTNVQMNQTLEQMAQAIFMSWFVDFDPVKAKMNGEQPEGMDAATASLFPEKLVESELGLIPEGWEASKLEDLVDIASSKRVFAKEYLKEGVPFYRGKEITELSKGNSVTPEIYISEERYQELKDKAGAPKKGDILITSVGTIGNTYLVDLEDKFYFKDGNLTWVRGYKGEEIPYFLMEWFNSAVGKCAVENIKIGSTQQAITIKSLNGIKLVSPPNDIHMKFTQLIEPLYRKHRANIKQSKALANLRDTLLPKLLSGEIELDVERVNAND